MFVPVVPHTTVVNKTIVYSDTVLSLNDKGSNLKITTISNVEEFMLDDCLRIIFESNPNVIFNTVQYSKNDKKVYFYTDKEIDISKYKKINTIEYKPIKNKQDILEEIKRIISFPKVNRYDCVSLNTAYEFILKKRNELKNKEKYYKRILDNMIKEKYGRDSGLVVHGFDYETGELSIAFKHFGSKYYNIDLKIKDEDLYVSSSETYESDDVFRLLYKQLTLLYNEYEKYREFYEQKTYHERPVNSNFFIDIDFYGVRIYNKDFFNKDFEIRYPSYSKEYEIECNSAKLMSVIEETQRDILNKIYIEIEKCPKWCRKELYDIRKKQLEPPIVEKKEVVKKKTLFDRFKSILK